MKTEQPEFVRYILKTTHLSDLQSMGSYLDVKNAVENALNMKLAVKGWESLFNKLQKLRFLVTNNETMLNNILAKNDSFASVKASFSELLECKVNAREISELQSSKENLFDLFTHEGEAAAWFEKNKFNNFKHSSRLEGITINSPYPESSLDKVLEKYRKPLNG